MLRLLTTKKYSTARIAHSFIHTKAAVNPPNISYLKPALFGTASCTTIFFLAACVHEREQETLWQKLKKHTGNTLREIIIDDNLVWADVYKEKKKLLQEYQQQLLSDLQHRLEQYQAMPIQLKRAVIASAETAFNMSECEKTLGSLIAINTAVFVAWRVPVLQRFMTRYFVHDPTRGRNITLLTSCFSHRNVLQFSLSMAGLWTFGPWLHDSLGREQFVALYLSLGIGANVLSHQLQLALRHVRPIVPSMGSSGAIYGLLGGTVYLYPDAIAFIGFLPWIPIKVSYAVPALLSTDVAGIILRWRMFDHLAHVSGAALGVAYMQFGPSTMWPFLLKTVSDLKKSAGKGKGSGGGGDKPSGAFMEMPEKIRAKLLRKKAIVPEKQ